MRLIDADAMKKDIEVQTQILKLMFKDDEDGLRLVDMTYEGCMAQIDKMPTVEPEQRWIPCSERLPDEDRAFLVTNSQWGYPLLEITYWLTDGWQTKGKPIAWLPLPKAYVGKTE